MAVQGQVRLRKHQFGRQASMGTKVAAKRAYPYKGVPDHNLNWTDPDIDSGSIAVVASPYRAAPELTAPLNFPSLYYNDLPLILSGFLGGGVTPTTVDVSGRQWAYTPAAVAPLDAIDLFTYEFGDDVTDDWFQDGDGLIESFEITGPEGLGALSATTAWRFGSTSSTGSTDSPVTGTVPTPGLTVDVDGTVVYLKDLGIFVASDYGDIATSQISDALHTFTLRGNQEYDLKRYANADQSFDIDDYGRGLRTLELECSWAKTSDTVGTGSFSDAWMSDTAVNMWVRLEATSLVLAGAATAFYKMTLDMPMRIYTREEGDIGGNTIVVLTGHSFDDEDDLGGDFKATVMTTLANADF